MNKQLLDALKKARSSLVGFKFIPGESNAWEVHDEHALADADEAIAAAEQAQQAEPVGYVAPEELPALKDGVAAFLYPSKDRHATQPVYAQPPAVAVPDGYAMVPVEATEEMEDAGFNAIAEYEKMIADRVFPRPTKVAHIYQSMLAAAQKGDK